MSAIGRAAEGETRVYFTGGATAVLVGWRESTIDVDLKLVPERDELLRALPQLKEELEINLELASPADFIPVPAGWEERSPFVGREGEVSFHHFDLTSQALSKIERGHAQDTADVAEMIARGLVEPDTVREHFRRIEPELYRFPAIDPAGFAGAVGCALGSG
ncbi:MAG: DUF6036 family nucleotidyltransferase [Solirubrobacterales bacterium]